MFFFIYVNDDVPNPIHSQNNKSQLAGDASQWAVSKCFSSRISAKGS